MKKILITGGAGFIGYHIAEALAAIGHCVIIIDSLTEYYSIRLKQHRINTLTNSHNITFIPLDICDTENLHLLFVKYKFQIVIHLAAQSGVRYSSVNPIAFAYANILGMTSILDFCKKYEVEHLMYASSSSVTSGNNIIGPISESIPTNTPLSFYAITKKTNEMMAEQFTASTSIASTGLRFFTVYGPYGRPDMAYWSFTQKILAEQPILVYGDGTVQRDFTYCSDVSNAVVRLLVGSRGIHRVINIGCGRPRTVIDMVHILEHLLDKSAIISMSPLPGTDPISTWSDNTVLSSVTNYTPTTNLETGLGNFVDWYKTYQSQDQMNKNA